MQRNVGSTRVNIDFNNEIRLNIINMPYFLILNLTSRVDICDVIIQFCPLWEIYARNMSSIVSFVDLGLPISRSFDGDMHKLF